jgi:hypothetical protein
MNSGSTSGSRARDGSRSGNGMGSTQYIDLEARRLGTAGSAAESQKKMFSNSKESSEVEVVLQGL